MGGRPREVRVDPRQESFEKQILNPLKFLSKKFCTNPWVDPQRAGSTHCQFFSKLSIKVGRPLLPWVDLLTGRCWGRPQNMRVDPLSNFSFWVINRGLVGRPIKTRVDPGWVDPGTSGRPTVQILEKNLWISPDFFLCTWAKFLYIH